MKPLDLTKTSPRSPREQLVGLVFIPRTIDKTRALLPGGNPGKYHVEGASLALLEGIGSIPRSSKSSLQRRLRRRRRRVAAGARRPIAVRRNQRTLHDHRAGRSVA